MKENRDKIDFPPPSFPTESFLPLCMYIHSFIHSAKAKGRSSRGRSMRSIRTSFDSGQRRSRREISASSTNPSFLVRGVAHVAAQNGLWVIAMQSKFPSSVPSIHLCTHTLYSYSISLFSPIF